MGKLHGEVSDVPKSHVLRTQLWSWRGHVRDVGKVHSY